MRLAVYRCCLRTRNGNQAGRDGDCPRLQGARSGQAESFPAPLPRPWACGRFGPCGGWGLRGWGPGKGSGSRGLGDRRNGPEAGHHEHGWRIAGVNWPALRTREGLWVHTGAKARGFPRPQNPPLAFQYLFAQFRLSRLPPASLHPVCQSALSPAPGGAMGHRNQNKPEL